MTKTNKTKTQHIIGLEVILNFGIKAKSHIMIMTIKLIFLQSTVSSVDI
jgi:hypothetical protein